MTLSTKVDGEWKEIKSLYCKVNGSWKSINELFAKEDGVWVTVFAGGAWIVFNKYPHPIPVAADWRYRVEGGEWVKVTEDGEINIDGGTFTGVVKARATLILDEWFTEEGVKIGEQGLRMDGTRLSKSGGNASTFVNGGNGYVCGRITIIDTSLDGYDTVDVYDVSGNRTTGTALSNPRGDSSSFVIGEKGYVCGGRVNEYSGSTTVDVYDSSGNRTTGTALSYNGGGSSSFVIGEKGYVCGSYIWSTTGSSTVNIYDVSGNRTTGTALSSKRGVASSFVIGEKGYVCGGIECNGAYSSSLVDIYDISGNRTSGAELSVARGNSTSFVNGGKGYVCGGSWSHRDYFDSARDVYNTVDVYDVSGNRTTGTEMSRSGGYLTSFVNGGKGYVCGGCKWEQYPSAKVDVYDVSGNRTTGNELSDGKSDPSSFVNGGKGYVCGGLRNYGGTYASYSSVDIYYDEEIPYAIAKIPITAGTSYTLNGISGTAPTSEVLTFGEKVSGTIRYQSGVLPRCALIYNKSLASDPSGCLEYTSVSKGYTPMSGASGSANEGSWASGTIFDDIEIGYLNGSTWVADSKAAMTGSTTYNCFTRIPKIYQRITQIDSNKVELAMDTKPFEGATLHPAFVMDGVEVNYKYIGRFLGRNVNSVLTSTSGGQPTHTLTRAEFRTLAKANGSSYGLMSYYDWDLVNKLFLFAFKSFDSQTALGKGWTGKTTYRNTGSSNGYAWNCGWQDATTVMSFMGIEDWWGNTFQFIDNFLTDASYIYASQSSNPTDNVADMTAICPNPSTLTGIPMTCRAGLNDFFVSASTGGSETTGLCDQQYYDAEVNGGRVGAYYASADAGGAFYLNAQNSISSSGATAGARLVHWE